MMGPAAGPLNFPRPVQADSAAVPPPSRHAPRTAPPSPAILVRSARAGRLSSSLDQLPPCAPRGQTQGGFASFTTFERDILRSSDVWRANAFGSPCRQGEFLVFGFVFAKKQALDKQGEADPFLAQQARVRASVWLCQLGVNLKRAYPGLDVTFAHRFAWINRAAQRMGDPRYIQASESGVTLIEDGSAIVLTNAVESDDERGGINGIFTLHDAQKLHLVSETECGGLDPVNLDPAQDKRVNWACLQFPVRQIDANTAKHIRLALCPASADGAESPSLFRAALSKKLADKAIGFLCERGRANAAVPSRLA